MVSKNYIKPSFNSQTRVRGSSHVLVNYESSVVNDLLDAFSIDVVLDVNRPMPWSMLVTGVVYCDVNSGIV